MQKIWDCSMKTKEIDLFIKERRAILKHRGKTKSIKAVSNNDIKLAHKLLLKFQKCVIVFFYLPSFVFGPVFKASFKNINHRKVEVPIFSNCYIKYEADKEMGEYLYRIKIEKLPFKPYIFLKRKLCLNMFWFYLFNFLHSSFSSP